MIKAVIIVNISGKARIVKFYEDMSNDRKNDIISKIYKECVSRGDHSCNFIEDSKIWNDFKIIFRQYATLYIIFVVDEGENELAILDMIQVLVEVMDKSFQNVCELDLIFYPEKIYSLLEEIIIGGMVIDTNITEIWRNVKDVFDHDKKK
ncbi:hypothetical protein SteCoe_5628 [Stentor coeruleus]|uniref:AP complex subunit sigma n=1 Tax=Stentor coeruleus TaxID=5963 RepID=A0A1R2CRX2_9CILI|nr:hypothetical protein SteCoe_5628 [Stentor coeruleus]